MTATGKITTARVIPGETRILVKVTGAGYATVSYTKVKDATPVLVLEKTPAPRDKYDRRQQWRLVCRTDDGGIVSIPRSAPSQTYWLA